MMTSRAEYRLLLRQDNADIRLRHKGYEAGLISEEQMRSINNKIFLIESEIQRLTKVNVKITDKLKTIMDANNSSPISTGTTLAELIRRPELSYEVLSPIDEERPELPDDVKEQVNINIKYSGYIEREKHQINQYLRAVSKRIPVDINYDKITNIRIEARQKLDKFRPETIAQASMIQGISPADIQVLMIYLKSEGY